MSDAAGDRAELHVRKNIRKPHKKSRNGCNECKKRKIKCDEKRPQCSNCNRHENTCSFTTRTSSPAGSRVATPQPGLMLSTPTSSSHFNTPSSISDFNATPISGDGGHSALNIGDLELLHNFNTSTAYTLSNVTALQVFLRTQVPQISFSHPFVLRAILAISALHLAHFHTGDVRAHYLAEAHHHYDIALRTATLLLPSINKETCAPIYLFATLCCFFTMATGPKPGDFLLFGKEGLAEWVILFRGMQTILQANFEELRHGILSPLFQISIDLVHQIRTENERIHELRELILKDSPNDPDLSIYLAAVDSLDTANANPALPGMRPQHSSPQMVFVCLYFFSEEYVALLQQRKQIPLVILAHFCVMLHDLSTFWWIKGWDIHLISEVYGSLNEQYRWWIRWCMEEIGWVPA